jgi:hypothetical protein
MKTSIVSIFALVVGCAGQAMAAGPSSFCPPANPADSVATRVSKVHDFCEVRWQHLMGASQTGGLGHDRLVSSCSSRCQGKLGQAKTGSDLNNIGAVAVPGVAIVGAAGIIAAGAVAVSLSSQPSSP